MAATGSPPSRPRLSTTKPAARPSTSNVALTVLLLTMVLVPAGIILMGRALLPVFDRLTSFTRVVPSRESTDHVAPTPDQPGFRVRVVDQDGAPVVRSTVVAVVFDPSPRLLREGVSDATGTCAFPEGTFMGVPLGAARVIALHDPEGVVTSGPLDEGLLTAPSPLELSLSARSAVRGSVVDAEGKPVGGATLAIDGMPWALPAETKTDPDGAFRLVTVPREASSLVASARGYLPGSAALAARGEDLDVRIALVAAPPVEGDVADPDGKPMRAHLVACEGEEGEVRGESADDGTFSLPATATGCGVVARHDAYAPSDATTAVAGVRLTLSLKVGGAIEGAVVDENGEAVSPYSIGIETSSASRARSHGGGGINVEDRSGEFRMDSLAPGTYVLTASAPGKPPTRSSPITVASGVTTRGVRIVLARGGVVRGHVLDEAGAPLAGVTVSFDEVSSAVRTRLQTTSDDSGAYVLEGAPLGPFSLRAEKKGFVVRLVTGLTADTGASLTEDITLTPSTNGAKLELGGIGAQLVPGPDGVVLRAVFAGDPAEQAGLRSGDRVVRIDNESTANMSMADVLQRLRGEPGSVVGVTVERGKPGAAETVDAVVQRATVVH